MTRFLHIFLLVISSLLVLGFSSTAQAVTVRTGENISITDETGLENVYLFGDSVNLDSSIQNDVVAAGNTVVINGDVAESVMVAGGTVTVRSPVGNSVRAAGGNMTIEGPIENDLLITAGTVIISPTASIGGDILFAGGKLTVNAPVAGDIRLSGGDVIINNEVGGNIDGNVAQLTLGDNAQIGGDVSYRSEHRADIAPNAVIAGEENFTQVNVDDDKIGGVLAGLLAIGTLYKLFADIVFALIFVFLFFVFSKTVLDDATKNPLKNGLVGFGALILIPIAALIGLVIFWVGISLFLVYGLLLIVVNALVKLFIGALILKWWYGRGSSKKGYVLDWKAAILGPIVGLIIFAIPFVGWIIGFVLYVVVAGGAVQYFAQVLNKQRITKK